VRHPRAVATARAAPAATNHAPAGSLPAITPALCWPGR
jgi:hypothetical protein